MSLYDSLCLNKCRFENQGSFRKPVILSFRSKNFELKNQRNKRFVKLFSNIQYASLWLHGTHRNGISFLGKLKQAYPYRWVSKPQLSSLYIIPPTLEEEERRPSLAFT